MPEHTAVTAPRHPTSARLLLAAVVALLVVGGLPTPAAAHGGIVPQPLVTDLPDGLPGLSATGLVAYAPRIRVTNDGPEPLTVVDDAGRPWLRISEDGVFADFSVRAWSESLDSSGRGGDPDPAIESTWTQVSALPTWEWFDTVLLPRTGDEEHDWSIPVEVGGAFDEIRGVLRESDLEGRWATDLLESGRVGEASLTAVSGPVPVFVVQLLEAEEVIVIGRHGEPLLRLTEAGFEVNRASPSWNDHARLDPDSAVGEVVEDPDAEPVWELHLADAPAATWLDVRAGSPDVAPGSRSAATITAEIPLLVDGEPYEVPVQTVWVGDEVPLLRITLPTLIAVSLGAGLLAAGAVRRWERRREAVDDVEAVEDGGAPPDPDTPEPEAVQQDA